MTMKFLLKHKHPGTEKEFGFCQHKVTAIMSAQILVLCLGFINQTHSPKLHDELVA